MQIREVASRHTWNEALQQLPSPHVLQSWEWGDFKANWGWAPTRFLFTFIGDNRPRAAAQVLRRPLASGSKWLKRLPLPTTLRLAVIYVPKGPILDYSDTPLLKQVISALEDHARRSGAIFIKIDPDVTLGEEEQPAAGVSGTVGEVMCSLLRARGWCPSPQQIQFKNTFLIDLGRDEKELLAAMKPKTRYNIRLAQRRGVTVRPGGIEDLSLFYAMYAETAERDGFIIRPFAYYRDVLERFLAVGQAHMLLAEVEQKVVAGLSLFRFGTTAWYMYGASTANHRSLMPNHILQWEAICWARGQGCTTYDLWGAPDILDESDPMWGVYRFKEGFGGRFVRHIGAWDYSPFPPLYQFYLFLMPRYLDRLRARHYTESRD
jgi:peptidoglycan pentaglycine glycine transferase (the first glycine)